MSIYGVAGDYFCVAVREGFCARIVGNMSVLDGKRDIFFSRGEGGGLPAGCSAAGGKVAAAPDRSAVVYVSKQILISKSTPRDRYLNPKGGSHTIRSNIVLSMIRPHSRPRPRLPSSIGLEDMLGRVL